MHARLSREAQADFDQIIDFLQTTAGAAVAARYGRSIQARINRLAQFPHMGSPRPALGTDIRAGRVAPYLVFYEVGADGAAIRVLRILHERRNITPDLVMDDER